MNAEQQSFSLLVLLLSMVLIVPFFKRVGLGSVLGYLAAGLLIGPFGLKFFNDFKAILQIAELGVVIFLFVIGLEMKPSQLWQLRKQIFGLGLLQVLTCCGLITLAGHFALGWAWQTSFIIASGFVLTSTAIVMAILSERGETNSVRGRKIVSILLLEDLMIVPLLAIVSFLSPLQTGSETATPIWFKLLATVGAVAALIVAGIWLLNPLFRLLAQTKLREIMTAAALLVVVSAGMLMESVGLSTAMGAFIAGVLLSNSSFRHQLEADLEPFRGLLLGLFFLGVGMSLNVPLVLNNFWHIFLSVLVLMMANGIGIFFIAKLTKSSLEEALDRAFVMALGGEFAFVLFSAAANQQVISDQAQANGTAIIVLSMVLSPILILGYKFVILPRLRKEETAQPNDEINDQLPIILIGLGRMGQIVRELLVMSGYQVTVIDKNIQMVEGMATFNVKSYYGDATRPELLATAGIEQAALLIVAIDSVENTNLIVENARRLNASVPIIVRTFDRRHSLTLFEKTEIQVRETFDSALRTGKQALLKMGLDEEKVEEIGQLYFNKDHHNLCQMAEVYDPNISGFKNQPLKQMAIEQDQELTRLIQEIVNREA
ncbi:potassium transporter [Rodentibacter trehalosifermentans]|uniref:Potassium transporter n=1 Tax=Rodentibacter trehalosifermentans TaxID=1908263 RepID=A0A1V3IN62_9PAST|nr:monovalent cation:proton antiporter-2 (CPA2) family protein [Rodentibacter trehalosifermentans]OOF43695.1 potassium transporter [Rodentibacter trehalosifermentans]